MRRLALLVALAGCADQPVREGVLADGSRYQDFSHIPYGYQRVVVAPDGRKEIRELHTEENFKRLQEGMTGPQVEDVVGVTSVGKLRHGNDTTTWSYRYYDYGIAKLLHVTFGPDGRMKYYETEWDPNVYSKKGGKR
jgi:hypothetical protein